MHVVLVMAGGLVLLGLFILFGWLWGGNVAGMALATTAFFPVWLLLTGINMWVGVAHAGYSVRDELPILLLVFAIPAAVACVVAWRLSLS